MSGSRRRHARRESQRHKAEDRPQRTIVYAGAHSRDIRSSQRTDRGRGTGPRQQPRAAHPGHSTGGGLPSGGKEPRGTDDQESGTVENLKQTVTGLGRPDSSDDGGMRSLTEGVLDIGHDPDERSETVEHLRETALDDGITDETRRQAIESLGSIGPAAESALAASAKLSRTEQTARAHADPGAQRGVTVSPARTAAGRRREILNTPSWRFVGSPSVGPRSRKRSSRPSGHSMRPGSARSVSTEKAGRVSGSHGNRRFL